MSETTPSPTPTPPGTPDSAPKGRLARYWWVVGLAIAGGVAILAATFASRDPDGLNAVAIDQGHRADRREIDVPLNELRAHGVARPQPVARRRRGVSERRARGSSSERGP